MRQEIYYLPNVFVAAKMDNKKLVILCFLCALVGFFIRPVFVLTHREKILANLPDGYEEFVDITSHWNADERRMLYESLRTGLVHQSDQDALQNLFEVSGMYSAYMVFEAEGQMAMRDLLVKRIESMRKALPSWQLTDIEKKLANAYIQRAERDGLIVIGRTEQDPQ